MAVIHGWWTWLFHIRDVRTSETQLALSRCNHRPASPYVSLSWQNTLKTPISFLSPAPDLLFSSPLQYDLRAIYNVRLKPFPSMQAKIIPPLCRYSRLTSAEDWFSSNGENDTKCCGLYCPNTAGVILQLNKNVTANLETVSFSKTQTLVAGICAFHDKGQYHQVNIFNLSYQQTKTTKKNVVTI